MVTKLQFIVSNLSFKAVKQVTGCLEIISHN